MKRYINFLTFFLSIGIVFLKLNLKLSLFFALSFSFINFTLWIIRTKKEKLDNWFNPVFLFFISYFIVYFQVPILILSGYKYYYKNFNSYDIELIAYCVTVSMVGICSFFLGEEIISTIFNKRSLSLKRTVFIVNSTNINIFKLFIGFLLLVSFSLFLNEMGGPRAFFGYNYGSWDALFVGKQNYFELIAFILFYILVIGEIDRLIIKYEPPIKKIINKVDLKLITLSLVFAMPYVFSGDRGSALEIFIILSGIYFILSKKLKLVSAVAIIVISSIILTSIGYIRSASKDNIIEEYKYRVQLVKENPFWPTIELANSYWTFYVAVNMFPESFNYTKGKKLLLNVLQIIPFGSKIFDTRNYLEKNNYIYNSSLFFTNIINRGNFTSGAGSSTLGDLYMEFGIVSIIITLFIWGGVVSWINAKALIQRHHIFIFLYSYLCYFAIYVNRSHFFYGWNKIIYAIILYSLIRPYLFKTFRKYKI